MGICNKCGGEIGPFNASNSRPNCYCREHEGKYHDILVENKNLSKRIDQAVAAVMRLQDENEHLKNLLKEVALCGYTDIDPRIDYLEVQIDRDTWEELQKVK